MYYSINCVISHSNKNARVHWSLLRIQEQIHIIIQMRGGPVATLRLFDGRTIASSSRVACQEVAVGYRYLLRDAVKSNFPLCFAYLFCALPTIGNEAADDGGAFEPTFCFVNQGCTGVVKSCVSLHRMRYSLTGDTRGQCCTLCLGATDARPEGRASV